MLFWGDCRACLDTYRCLYDTHTHTHTHIHTHARTCMLYTCMCMICRKQCMTYRHMCMELIHVCMANTHTRTPSTCVCIYKHQSSPGRCQLVSRVKSVGKNIQPEQNSCCSTTMWSHDWHKKRCSLPQVCASLKSINCLWTAYTLPTDCLQIAHRLHGDCLQSACNLPTVCLQSAYSLPTGCLQSAYRLPAVCP